MRCPACGCGRTENARCVPWGSLLSGELAEARDVERRMIVPAQADDFPGALFVDQLKRVDASLQIVGGERRNFRFVGAGDVHDVAEAIRSAGDFPLVEARERPDLDQLL